MASVKMVKIGKSIFLVWWGTIPILFFVGGHPPSYGPDMKTNKIKVDTVF